MDEVVETFKLKAKNALKTPFFDCLACENDHFSQMDKF